MNDFISHISGFLVPPGAVPGRLSPTGVWCVCVCLRWRVEEKKSLPPSLF